MQCKIFYGSNRAELEKAVNAWLEKMEIHPQSILALQFSTASVDVGDQYKLEHTLVLLYQPMHPIG